MAGEDFTERFVSGEQIFSGRLLQVRRDTVRMPNGAEVTREYIRHPGAAAVLALTDDGCVVLERQYRYALARDFLEIPAGKVDAGDGLLDTAKRELLEETGYVASDWRRLATLHSAIGYSDEAIELFLARGLEQRARRLDAGEFLEVLLLPLAQAVAMVRDGSLTDVKTVTALLWVEAFGPFGA